MTPFFAECEGEGGTYTDMEYAKRKRQPCHGGWKFFDNVPLFNPGSYVYHQHPLLSSLGVQLTTIHVAIIIKINNSFCIYSFLFL